MPRTSPNNITSINQDWGYDEQSGLPFSGTAIQQFIKSNLGEIARACHFDSTDATLRWFKSEEDYNSYIDNPQDKTKVLFSVPITFSSELFRINLINNNNTTTLNVATNQDEVNLSLGFEVQRKAVTETIWSGTERAAKIVAYIDVGATGTFVQIHEPTLYSREQTYTLNVRDYLIEGSNRIRIQLFDEEDESVSTSITYTINLTNLFIEPLNNSWYIPIIEGGDESNYKLGGFRIVGSLNKTLHLDVYSASSDVKLREFTYDLYTSSYDTTPFNYTRAFGFNLGHQDGKADLVTGVYMISAYLTSGTGNDILKTESLNYNIMYITASDISSAQLVCINNVSDEIYNYTTSKMFDYSVYNRGMMTGSPHILVNQVTGTSPTIIIDETLSDVATSEVQSFEVPLQWLTEDTLNLFVTATMIFGNEQFVSVKVNNQKTFPPTRGFDFYLDCSSRNNSNSNREKLVNEVNKGEFTPIWDRMTWADGVDGWISDDIDRKCLYVRAGSKMTLPFTEQTIMSGENTTLELCYKISNVADYDETVISIMDNRDLEGFRGIRIKPTNITVHSSEDSTSVNDITRGTNVMDEQVVHFVLTISRNFGRQGMNLATGYINGCKNFQFSYATGAQWLVQGPFIVGGDKSDVSLYYLRTYPSVLSDANIQDNYINSIKDINGRQDLHDLLLSVTEANGSTISYENVKNHNKNFFVIEMLNGASVPSQANGWAKDTVGYSNLEMHYGTHPEWDWKINNVETSGQGTTSMGYYRWNIRWRIDKSPNKKAGIQYLDSRTLSAGKYIYDGSGNHPNVKRITAKINFASSMQSHKIGATRAYTDLHDRVGLENEAQNFAKSNNLPVPTVAVYEYPAYGFVKNGDSYTFIGLFTIGPDKGDKSTFGYDIDDTIKTKLITLEGSDHDRRVVMFSHPWNEKMIYSASDEFLSLLPYSGNKRGGWEVSNCHGYSTDKASDESNIQSVLETEFKPAYDVAFNNSTMIFGISKSEYDNATASQILTIINSDPAAFGAIVRDGNRISNSNYQFWIEDEYILYYINAETGVYVAGQNLVTEHGIPSGNTVDEQNEWFKARRRERFKQNAEDSWDIQDCLFHYAFIICVGAVDNFGKNTYPYKMKELANGGRWKWRQDDLDSILGINNSGYDSVPSWSEYEDMVAKGSVYYGGSASVFWTLIHECYMEDYISTVTNVATNGILSMGKSILNAMSIASGGVNIVSGVLDYFNKTFWDNAQNYFPQSAYNTDAAFKYEQAWLAGAVQQAQPLPQSLGNHFSAEYLWVYNRVIYLLSLFRAGPFGDYANTALGTISFRPVALPSITVTPFYKLYPGIGDGTTMRNGTRTNAGSDYTFVGPFSNQGQTTMYINGSNLLSYLGDLKDLTVDLTLTPTLSINGKKLLAFKIGDEDKFTDELISSAIYYTQEEIDNAEEGDDAYGKTTEDIKIPAVYKLNVTTNVTGLSFNNVPCLEYIDARNASSIQGIVDISSCTRLRSAYFYGTNVTGVKFTNGQPIEYLSLPETISTLSMRNLSYLTSETLVLPEDLSNISLLQIENCGFDAVDLLSEAYNSDNSSLTNISITLPDIIDIDSNLLSMLSNIASGKDKDGNVRAYHGVNTDGSPADTGTPNIIGSVKMNTPFYPSDFTALGMNPTNERDYDENGLKINGITNLGSLQLIYDPNNRYIEFKDPIVEQICATTWGDGVGVTEAQAATATTVLKSEFVGQTDIVSFDEFRYFRKVTFSGSTTYDYGFSGCTNLESIHMPETSSRLTLALATFQNCQKLEEIHFHSAFNSYAKYECFRYCYALTKIYFDSLDQLLDSTHGDIVADNRYTMPLRASDGGHIYIGDSELTELIIPEGRTYINSVFGYCRYLTSVTIPSTATSIGSSAFYRCSGLTSIVIPQSVTTINQNAFRYCTGLRSVTILGNVERGTSNVFANCTALEEFHFLGTSSNNNTNSQWFTSCSSLTKLYFNDFEQSMSLIPDTTSFYSESNPFGANSGTHYVYFDDEEVRDLVIPNTITTIRAGACYRWNRLTSVTIPSSVTTIGANAFAGCTGLTTVSIPSTVSSLGGSSFNGCTGIINFYDYRSTETLSNIIPVTNTPHIGNGTGVFYIKGDINFRPSDNYLDFRQIIIGGNATVTATYDNRHFARGNYIRECRIAGNIDFSTVSWCTFVYSTAIKFFELGGDVNSNSLIYNAGSNIIVHLGKSGVACPPSRIISSNGYSRISKIYVGDGSSAEHDNAILEAYQANADWQEASTMLAKLDTWYNYDGEYKILPTIPTI